MERKTDRITRDADRLPTQTRVAVFRGLPGIGDLLVAVPALRLLRASLPGVRIALIAPEAVRGLALRFRGLFDEFVEFPGWPGLGWADAGRADGRGPGVAGPEGRDSEGSLAEWRGADVVVQMHGDGTVSNGFCQSLSPKTLVAFGPVVSWGGCVVRTSAYPRRQRERDRCLLLAERAARVLHGDVAPMRRALEFPIFDDDVHEAGAALAKATAAGPQALQTGPYFVLHPGSARDESRWPLRRFVAVGKRLARDGAVLVTGGEAETELAATAARLVGAGALSLAGRLSLGALAAVLAGAAGVVTNDTGVAHLAEAVGAPSVVVFMASDPERWASNDTALHAAVVSRAGEREQATVTPEGSRLAVPAVASVLSAATSVGMIS